MDRDKMENSHFRGLSAPKITEKFLSEQEKSVLLYHLLHSVLMFSLSFGAFFGTKTILREYTEFANFTITSLSVASAVITIHIIIGFYVYEAYTEENIEMSTEQTLKKQR